MNLSKIILTLLFILFGYNATSQTAVADSLRQVVDDHPNDTVGIKALINLASEVARKDLEKVKEYAFQGLRMANAQKTNFGVSSNYSHLITYYSNKGMPDSAVFYLDKMKLLAEANPQESYLLSNYYSQAGLFYKNKGEFDKALPLMVEALKYMDGPKHQLGRAGQLLNIGNVYNHLGDITKAADYHLKALKQFEELGNKRGQSFCLQSLGNDYQKLGRVSEAKKYFEQSLALKETLGDTRGMITSWINLGSMHTELGQYKVAQEYFRKSLKESRDLNLTQNELTVLHQLGLLYLKMDQIAKARATFKQGLPLARQRGDSLISARFAAQLANLQQDSLKQHAIEQALLNKLQTARDAGDRELEADTYLQLADRHAGNKQFEQAFDLLKKHYKLKDSVAGKEVLLQLKQLEEQYEQEKSTKEIMLLKKDQQLKEAVIEKQLANQKIFTIVFVAFILIAILLLKYYQTVYRTKRLIAIERVRNSLARDLHDDIGSALSSIHINSQLALRDSAQAQAHLQRIGESAARMMESMSDMVWSINPENDTLEKMLVRMKEFAADMLEPKNISYSFEVCDELEKTKLSEETRKSLYLIFKESINNAAKYSEGSSVVITIKMLQNKLHLRVRDNGKGFDVAAIRHGNGLQNMAERAHSLRGQLIRQSAPGQGTEIVAELPIT